MEVQVKATFLGVSFIIVASSLLIVMLVRIPASPAPTDLPTGPPFVDRPPGNQIGVEN